MVSPAVSRMILAPVLRIIRGEARVIDFYATLSPVTGEAWLFSFRYIHRPN